MIDIFDHKLLEAHKNRASQNIHNHDFLFKLSCEELLERASFYSNQYNNTLLINPCGHDRNKMPIKTYNLYMADLSYRMLRKSLYSSYNTTSKVKQDNELATSSPTEGRTNEVIFKNANCYNTRNNEYRGAIHIDLENQPFNSDSFDLIISNLNIHWINNIPKTFTQIKYSLSDDGLFIGSAIGESSLKNLRYLLIEIESKLGCDTGFHFSPMISKYNMTQLLQKSGFKNVAVDSDIIAVEYKNALSAMKDLQNMGESNALYKKIKPLKKRVYNYILNHCNQPITIEFEIITFCGKS